jgi:hypothetical protein
MSWGWRIALFYGTFVVFMVGMVVLAFQQDFDLVADDYYEQEIAYQGRIDQMTNAKEDGQKLKVLNTENAVLLTFPNVVQDVKVHVFRPSDDTMDFMLEEANVDADIVIPNDRFTKGKYLIKVEWKNDGKTYFQEQILLID